MFSDLFHRKETQPVEARAVTLTKAKLDRPYEPEDELLVAHARRGDMAAFEALFVRHRATVYRFIYQMGGRQDDADDLTQESFVRAFESLHRFREECRFTTWIMRIAANLCTDRARMRSRRSQLLQQQATDGLTWMTEDHSTDPLHSLEGDRRARAVHLALQALPIHHRTVLILRDFEEQDYQLIAETLNCTVGGAKLRVLRARRALRDRLAPLLGEESSL
ncbi:MAG: sigma-70 family RNA polymerase sigma factor [bacterium]|jgi:RNA polymerase sigma-70 factor (ECF subfamily)